ncbi:hypothetical protein RHMOL_Rhmol08G0028100 [Rhododendron molle]|uniref:Uncharacterized protein n=1 Tax=Rhododendron molle TaxID=49168 RepID=A0ACC0MJQ2_RHOML|nr:hypothetical protein RHMOL_Rhmol08G0028100 [Rhododendron molle]
MGLTASPRLIFLLLLCFAAAVALPSSAQKLKTFREEYGRPFNESYYDIFAVEKPATISNDALQITPDSRQGEFNLKNRSGRVFLKQRFKLWEGNSTSAQIASFNASFLINIYRFGNTTPAEGLAFVVGPDLNLPLNSSGQYLGLTNATTDSSPTNKIVAVEIDTFKDNDDFDPDANHIGLDINSVKSRNVTSLDPFGIDIAPVGEARFHNVWVQYDGVEKEIAVFITRQHEKDGDTPPRPDAPVLKTSLDLRDIVDQYSYFGFSASTGTFEQLNCVLRWNLTVLYFPEGKKPWVGISIGAGVPVLVLVLVGAMVMGYYYRQKRRLAWSNSNILGALTKLPGTPREFKFKDLKKATNNFDGKNKLGQGGYGVVYRGHLQNENLEVAVKWFSRGNLKGQDDFLAELTIINRLRHKHLVRLLGKRFNSYFRLNGTE